MSSSIDPTIGPSSHITGKRKQVLRDKPNPRAIRRNMGFGTRRRALTPPPAIAGPSDESSSDEGYNSSSEGEYVQPLSVSGGESPPRRPSNRGWNMLCGDLDGRFKQILHRESSLAKHVGSAELTRQMLWGEPSQQSIGNATEKARDSFSFQQRSPRASDTPEITPYPDRQVCATSLAATQESSDDGFSAVPGNTADRVEQKLDYLNSLLAKREQSIFTQDFVARQAADEEKLRRLEEKLVQPQQGLGLFQEEDENNNIPQPAARSSVPAVDGGPIQETENPKGAESEENRKCGCRYSNAWKTALFGPKEYKILQEKALSNATGKAPLR
ncbi:uncharacterized protein Z519_12785 [Cladophialophora bantiana CBS 173.52]|uniref:Uncharacterized protein n=1 Tax=Cladophialophora bantiana (strain ATCC 10958 / CBS 173.52 / CDC B-1940 / NIH 8579) TaxID=1442370 RepID=A0A0D2E916_CLAB1|nr:uncharacterized protein Z519_12785 [Cladophialophora bantiana CBS 173.52]KIW86601.1 hypothetical protein Z519_12785 [Cladophialophora bantiana CBS 173.52]